MTGDVPYRRYAAPPVGSPSVRCELLPAVVARPRDEEPRRQKRRVVKGDWVRINADDERAGQPDGEVSRVDEFPPGRCVTVQPPGHTVPWFRWENEVHHVPRPGR